MALACVNVSGFHCQGGAKDTALDRQDVLAALRQECRIQSAAHCSIVVFSVVDRKELYDRHLGSGRVLRLQQCCRLAAKPKGWP